MKVVINQIKLSGHPSISGRNSKQEKLELNLLPKKNFYRNPYISHGATAKT